MSVRLGSALLVAAIGLTAGCANGRLAIEPASDAAEVEFEYHIPPGTGDRMDAGEDVAILPAEIDATVGEAIRVINNDTRGHTVGWMYVGPGEVVTQRFSSEGVFVGRCTVHPSGEVRLVVEP